MSLTSRFIPNSIVLTSSSAFQHALAIIFSIVVARLLKVDNFGIYSIVMTFCAIGAFFSDLSLSQFAIREFPRTRKHPEALLSRLIALKLGFSFFVYWFLQIAVQVLGYEAMAQEGVRIVTLCFFFGAVSGSFATVFLAKEQPITPSVISFLCGSLYTFIGIFLLWKGLGLINVFWTKVIVDAVAAAGMFMVFRKKFNWPFVKPELEHLFELIKQARPFILIALIAIIQQHANILILSSLAPAPRNAQVGYYAAARGLLSPTLILSQSVCVAMLPWMSERVYFRKDLKNVKKRVWKTSMVLFLGAGIPLVIGVFCFGEWGIKTILGNDFLAAVPTAQVLSFAFAIQLLNGPIANTMLCSSKFSKYIVFYGLIVLFQVLLAFFLIPKYGHLGAAYANLFGPMVGSVFLIRVAQIELR